MKRELNDEEKNQIVSVSAEVYGLIDKLRVTLNEFVLDKSTPNTDHNTRILMAMRAINATNMDFCLTQGGFLKHEADEIEIRLKRANDCVKDLEATEKVENAPQNP